MNIVKCKDYNEIGLKAAEIIASQIKTKLDSVIGFATGSTPIGTYKELVRLYNEKTIDFKDVTSFNLDEYCNLSKDSDQSYFYFMMNNLFNHINIDKNKINIPDGMAKDFKKECIDYEEKIKKAGGIDLQILGVGTNGHIGFNEPDKVFYDNTRIVSLHESTISANSRFFQSVGEVPKKALSMGIGTIMRAGKIILLASGKDKKDAINKLIYGDIDPYVPVSILRFHKNVTVIVDTEVLE